VLCRICSTSFRVDISIKSFAIFARESVLSSSECSYTLITSIATADKFAIMPSFAEIQLQTYNWQTSRETKATQPQNVSTTRYLSKNTITWPDFLSKRRLIHLRNGEPPASSNFQPRGLTQHVLFAVTQLSSINVALDLCFCDVFTLFAFDFTFIIYNFMSD